jgi:TRAP-type C4-dicarboxylate transport system permease large subunit
VIIQSNSQKPSQELSIEEVLTRTFELYSHNFIQFLIPLLVATLVSGSLGTLTTRYIEIMPPPEYGAPPEIWNWIWSYVVTLLAITFIVGIISWMVSTIANGICVRFASDLMEKGNASLEDALNFTVFKLLSLLVAAIITGILIVLGLIALFVPGIILAIMFSLVVQVIIIEDVGALDSLSRSRRLVSSRWSKTFVLLLIVYIIILFVGFVGNLIGTPFGGAGSIVSSVIATFVARIIPISLTVYYYSMVAKEEQLRVPPPPPPPF